MEPGTRHCTGLPLLLLLLFPATTTPQITAECPTSECTGPRDAPRARSPLWVEAAAIHNVKLEFVEALQRFMRAQAGLLGDEGADLRASVAAMRETLDRWDRRVQQFQAASRRALPVVEAHVAAATVFLDRHRLEDALRELEAARNQDGSRADVYALQALAHAASNRPSEASRALRRATALDPDNPVTLYMLSQHLAHLGQAADAARARRDLQRLLQRRGEGAGGGRSGTASFDRVDLLRQAAGVAPIFPQARYESGFASLRTGDYANAVASFSDAVAADPMLAGEAPGRESLVGAASMIRAGRLDEAIGQLRATVARWPEYAEAHRVLGVAYSLDDQQGKSIEHLRTSVRLVAGDERARLALAEVLAEDRRLAEAERELTQAIDGGLRSGGVRYQLARVRERQSLLPRAAESLHAAESFGPVVGRDQFYRELGSVLVNLGDVEGAIAAYSRRIEANPNSGEAHRQLGEIYFLQGRDDEALTEFFTAAWLDPRDAKAYAGAGQAQLRLLRYAAAADALARALSLDPGLKEARYALGMSLMRLGKADDARRELETFQRQQAAADTLGQRAFELDALRREGSRSLLAGAFDQAIASYEEALTLDPASARSHRDLGLAMLRMKRPQEAIEHLDAAQRIEPTAEGFAYLSDAHAAAGNRDEAMRQRALSQQLVRQAKLDRLGELLR